MKVVHINISDKIGGAAIAAYRLHKALLKLNISSKMLVLNKTLDEKEIKSFYSSQISKFICTKTRNISEKLRLKKYKNREKIIFSTGISGVNLLKNRDILEADIIHIHWINNNFIKIKDIYELSKIKKVIWTFHDSWPFTGGCHVRYKCYEYKTGCSKCKILNYENGISKKIFRDKIKYLNSSNQLKIIVPSNWLKNEVLQGQLFTKNQIKVIPNPLDDTIFKKIDRKVARKILNLDLNKKYILFGACSATTTPYKGFSYLIEALIKINKKFPLLKNDLEILVFGASFSEDENKIPFKMNFLGHIFDEITMAILYNASNVFIGPSIEEAFGQTFNESISCGTPAVGFKQTGVEDIINHKINGYLADYKNTTDLANGIIESLNYTDKINSNFNQNEIIKKIIEYYRS